MEKNYLVMNDWYWHIDANSEEVMPELDASGKVPTYNYDAREKVEDELTDDIPYETFGNWVFLADYWKRLGYITE